MTATVENEKKDQVPSTERARTMRVFTPEVDIYERSGDIVVVADMPHVDEKSAHVSLENDILTIEGHSTPTALTDRRLARAEYVCGDYRRTFELMADIDRDAIRATMKHGVLTVVLPKAKAPSAKKITVTSE